MEAAFQSLPEAANRDPEFLIAAKHFTVSLTLRVGDRAFAYDIAGGRFGAGAPPSPLRDARFALTLRDSAAGWTKLLAATPEPHYHEITGAEARGTMKRETDNPAAAQAFRPALRRVVDVLRELLHGAASSSRSGPIPRPHRGAKVDAAVGRYVYLEIAGVEYRVYFEEAGAAGGVPLLCQHTAGADGRQYRHILEDEELQRSYRIIAYDLPFHGRSLPPTEVEWWKSEWRLTLEFFMQVPLALARALSLDRPVFMGSSIGGMLAVDLAYHHPADFRAVVGLEAALATGTRHVVDRLEKKGAVTGEVLHGALRHPRASNAGNGAFMYGLTAPQCPEPYRREVAWVYSQGGPGVFAGDLWYYDVAHDLRGKAGSIDTRQCGVYLLTGEYDWSATPEMTEELHREIKGSTFVRMPGIGHFPMCENPTLFLKYLRPVLADIASKTPTAANLVGSKSRL